MSILIRGMEMPTSCYVCPFCDYVSARCDAVKGTPYTPTNRYEVRADWCPLVPVPEHGRLIDASALLQSIKEARKAQPEIADVYDDDYFLVAEWLASAPTIIPADGNLYDSIKRGLEQAINGESRSETITAEEVEG